MDQDQVEGRHCGPQRNRSQVSTAHFLRKCAPREGREWQRTGNCCRFTVMISRTFNSGRKAYPFQTRLNNKRCYKLIANYPDRCFQMWEYQVTHGSLLIMADMKRNRIFRGFPVLFRI